MLRVFEDELSNFPLFGTNCRFVAVDPRPFVDGAIDAVVPEAVSLSFLGDRDDLFCVG